MSQLASKALGSRLLLLLCGLGVMTASPAQNLAFLQSSPIYYFQDDDVNMMLANAKAVLDSASGAKQQWSNPRTGAAGLAQVKKRFTNADGTPCARLRVANKARGVESDTVYTVCKSPARGWEVNPDAKPPPAPAP